MPHGFFRHSLRASLRSFGLFAVRYNPDGDAGGGGQAATDPPATGAGGAGAAANTPNPDLIPKAEAARAFKARDEAKKSAQRAEAVQRALAAKFGVDPDEFEVVETGDPANPFEVKGAGVDQTAAELAEARKAKVDGLKKKGDWETREKELADNYAKKEKKLSQDWEGKLKQTTEQSTKRTAALESWIRDAAVLSPIRAACTAEGAIDPDNSGSYAPIIKLLGDRVKVETAVNEETGRAEVQVTPLDENGSPMTDGKGNPVSVRQLVADFLNKNSYLRQSKFRPGPGAGGSGGAAGAGGRTAATLAEQGRAAADRMFGLKPESSNGNGR